MAGRSNGPDGAGCFLIFIIGGIVVFAVFNWLTSNPANLIGALVVIGVIIFLVKKLNLWAAKGDCPTCHRDPGTSRICRNCGRVVPGR